MAKHPNDEHIATKQRGGKLEFCEIYFYLLKAEQAAFSYRTNNR